MTPESREWIWNAPGVYRALGITVFLIYLAISLYHLRQTRFARVRLLSEGLKFCGAVLLLLTLLQPEVHTRSARTENARIAVVVDDTDSMLTPDVNAAGQPATRKEWIEHLQSRPEWEALAETVQLDLVRLGHEEESAVRHTDLRSGLSRAADREDLSAVLMLTDGDHNAPGSPLPEALRLAERQVPVFAVEIGQTTRLPDLVLEPVSFPSYTLINEALILPVRVTSSLPEDTRSQVTLLADGQPVARQEIDLPAGQEGNATLRWVPREEGPVSLTVQVDPHPLERFLDNNEATAELDVRRTTIRVLLIDSLPRWEFRFLRNALLRDPGVEVTSLLFHPELGPGGGPGYISAFPDDPEEWGAFDVIFLGDVGVGTNELSEEDTRNIALLVREQAGGLVFLPGARGGHLRLLGTPLEALMPVELDPNLPRGVGMDVEMRMALTREGRDHMLTQLHGNPLRNQQIWRNLPGFFWYAGVTRARVGSEVLATHASHRNESGRIPLLATRNAGTGHVLFLGTDAAYRWRIGVEDLYHYRFWGQVVRWMAHRRQMFGDEGSRVFLQPERPEAGQANRITVVLRGGMAGPGDAPVRMRMTDPEGEVVTPSLEALEGGGAFAADWTPSRPGDHRLELISPDESAQVLLDREIRVEGRIVERIGDPMRPRLLREMAGVTGGQSVHIDEAADLLARLRDLPRQQVTVTVRRLWQHPLWIIGVFLFFGLYWVIRKQQGWV
jgi:hypothetical protein